MSFKWALDLVNKMSGPAKQAAQSLASVNKALVQVSASAQQASNALGSVGSKASAAFARMSAGARNLATKGFGGLQKSAKDLMPSLGDIGKFVAGNLIAGGITKLASMGLDLVRDSFNVVADAQAFRENTLFAFKYLAGGQQEALAMFDRADRLARSLGQRTSVVGESMRELMAGGFTEDMSRAVTSAIADVKALNPSANITAISTQLAQMKGAGRVLMEDLKPLLNAGVNDDIFYQVLREMTGKKDQVALKKMMEAGKVSADTGINAILETVRRMGGGGALGDVAAAKASSTVGGALENLKAQAERVFMSIDTSPLGASIMRISETLRKALDPSEAGGGKLVNMLSGIASFGADMLEGLLGGSTLPAIIDGVTKFGNIVLPLFKALGGGLLTGLGEGFGILRDVFSKLGGSDSTMLIDALGKVGRGMGWIITAVATLIGLTLGWSATLSGVVYVAIGYVVDALRGWFNMFAGLGALLGNAVDVMVKFGGDLVTGLWNGIKSGWTWLIDGVKGLFDMLPAAARAVLQIRSPSRVMADIGGQTAAGFDVGVRAGTPDARDAMTDLVSPKLPAPRAGDYAGARERAAGMFGGGGLTIGTVNIPVTVHSNASSSAEAAKEVAQVTFNKVIEAFESVGLEAGAAGPALCRSLFGAEAARRLSLKTSGRLGIR